MRAVLALTTLMLCSVLTAAQAQYIGMYTEPEPAPPVDSEPPQPFLNSVLVPVQVPVPVYIVAHTTGVSWIGGVTGVQFRIDGFPPTDEFLFPHEPNPAANLSLGNMVDGINLAFPSCETASGTEAVLLYSGQFIALTPVENVTLHFKAHPNPAWGIPFPLLIGCDAPDPPTVVATSVPITINPIVGVASRSWSAIKEQYR